MEWLRKLWVYFIVLICLVTSDPHDSRNPVDNLTNGDAMYVRTFLREIQKNWLSIKALSMRPRPILRGLPSSIQLRNTPSSKLTIPVWSHSMRSETLYALLRRTVTESDPCLLPTWCKYYFPLHCGCRAHPGTYYSHVPFGCSVWPVSLFSPILIIDHNLSSYLQAWWSQAPNWPTGGEIDMFEGVNQVTQNQMSLHTEPGCTQVSPNQTSTIVNSTDCSFEANNNQGCIVTNPSELSYGAGFANAGGGQFVTELAEDGIRCVSKRCHICRVLIFWFAPLSGCGSSL